MRKLPRIIFIHGIGSKPPKAVHLQEWAKALRLSTQPLPDSALRMAYWADERAKLAEREGEQEVVRGMSPVQRRLLAATKSSKAEHVTLLDRIWNLIREEALDVADPLVKHFLDQYVEDAYLYFYVAGKRVAIANRLKKELLESRTESRRTAVIAHSWGTVVALDVLRQWGWPIELLITMGSPLGLAWIQHKLGNPRFPAGVTKWLNVYDRADPVTLPDQNIHNDFPRLHGVEDVQIRDNYSPGGERDPHSWYGYLSSEEVGEAVGSFIRRE